MAIEVFNRYENKYLLSEDAFQAIERRLSDYMEPDEFNRGGACYPIANVYYDTWDSLLIRMSLSKPKFKEKLRLRAYGTPGAGSRVYVEIKKKYKGIVNKRRTGMPLQDAERFLATGEPPQNKEGVNELVLQEIRNFLARYRLVPTVYLSYERRAWFNKGEHDLRVSFDTNILSRRTDVRLESGAYGERLLPEGVRLMEVKSGYSIPFWLSRLLSEYAVYPVSFSKYGMEYKKRLREGFIQAAWRPQPVAAVGGNAMGRVAASSQQPPAILLPQHASTY